MIKFHFQMSKTLFYNLLIVVTRSHKSSTCRITPYRVPRTYHVHADVELSLSYETIVEISLSLSLSFFPKSSYRPIPENYV